MKMQSWKHFLLVVFLALPLVMASDCPGSSPLEPGNGEVQVSLKVTNLSPTDRFIDDPIGDFPNFIFPDFAGVQMLRIWVEPVDPAAAAATPSLPLELLGQIPFETDWAEFPLDRRMATLSNGTYRVRRIDLGELYFEDSSDGMGGNSVFPSNWANPNQPTCQDFIRFFNITSSQTFQQTDLGDVFFDVTGSGDNTLKVRIDGDAFIAAWYQSTTCSSCKCPAQYNPNDPSTLDCECFVSATNFNAATFRSLVSTFLRFE